MTPSAQDAPGGASRGRTAIALFLVGIAASVWLTEGAFAQADHRKALALVREHRLGGDSLETFLLRQVADRAGDPVWSTDIMSSCRGVVRVRCAVPRKNQSAAAYAFDVDLPQKGIHPADEQARRLLLQFSRESVGNSAPRKPDGAPGDAPLDTP